METQCTKPLEYSKISSKEEIQSDNYLLFKKERKKIPNKQPNFTHQGTGEKRTK